MIVSLVEKANLEGIRRLLEITEAERNHELLFSMNNLQELGANPFRYIVPVIPRSLPEELVMGEHFDLVNLLKSIPGNSSQAGSIEEPQAKIAHETSATFAQPDQSHLEKQDYRPTP